MDVGQPSQPAAELPRCRLLARNNFRLARDPGITENRFTQADFPGLILAYKADACGCRRFHKVCSSRCTPFLICWRNLSDPFFQGYGYCVTHSLPDRSANVCP